MSKARAIKRYNEECTPTVAWLVPFSQTYTEHTTFNPKISSQSLHYSVCVCVCVEAVELFFNFSFFFLFPDMARIHIPNERAQEKENFILFYFIYSRDVAQLGV